VHTLITSRASEKDWAEVDQQTYESKEMKVTGDDISQQKW